jgi:hypothetical protein
MRIWALVGQHDRAFSRVVLKRADLKFWLNVAARQRPPHSARLILDAAVFIRGANAVERSPLQLAQQ